MTQPMATRHEGTVRQPGRSRPSIAQMLSVEAAAVAAAVLVWVAAGPLGGVTLAVGSGDAIREIRFGDVIATSGIVTAVAVSLMLLLLRLSKRGRRTWTIVATGLLVLSLLGPAGASSGAAWASLTCMHLVVGAVVIGGLRRATTDG